MLPVTIISCSLWWSYHLDTLSCTSATPRTSIPLSASPADWLRRQPSVKVTVTSTSVHQDASEIATPKSNCSDTKNYLHIKFMKLPFREYKRKWASLYKLKGCRETVLWCVDTNMVRMLETKTQTCSEDSKPTTHLASEYQKGDIRRETVNAILQLTEQTLNNQFWSWANISYWEFLWQTINK